MFKSKLGGKFNVTIKRNGKVRYESGETKNMWTNAGLSEAAYISNAYLVVGTGATPPASTDTTLDNLLLRSPSGVSAGDTSNVLVGDTQVGTTTVRYTYTLGSVIGNLTELGLISNSNVNTATLYTRALFKDVAGNPTTLTLTSEDQLVIEYTITRVTDLNTLTGSFMLGDKTINYKIHKARPTIEGIGAPRAPVGDFVRPYFQPTSEKPFDITPGTYLPTSIAGAPDINRNYTIHSAVATFAGPGIKEYKHVIPLTKGNGVWKWGVYSDVYYIGWDRCPVLIEFTGPDYVTKADTDIVTIVFREIVTQL